MTDSTIRLDYQELFEWNRKVPRAADTLVHCIIEAQATQHPESCAVCSWDGDLTYKELDALSSRLGDFLVTQGVYPEVIVPLCFEKSMWTIVGLLAVLKAGGAFLLLDMSLPIARLESMIQNTGGRLALSSAAYFDTCRSIVTQTFMVDAALYIKLDNISRRTWPSPELNNAAYCIFTSGSTGNPKCVVVEHSQLSTTATYYGEHFRLGRESRVFQFSSYAWDPYITDIFTTLLCGGTICIPSEWERNNTVVNVMRRMENTCAKFAPSLFRNLIIEDLPTLTTLILGGESSSQSLVDEWRSKLKLLLTYGPTECCVTCFISDASLHKPVPGEVGRPVNAGAWIVKQDNLNDVAEVGEVGELLIGGPLLSRGYLNDPAQTERQLSKAHLGRLLVVSPQTVPDYTGLEIWQNISKMERFASQGELITRSNFAGSVLNLKKLERGSMIA